jgi:hypothetical protein
VTIAPVTPYVAAQGELSKYVHYYLGWRRDEIDIDNQDLITPANSWSKWVGVNSPKATLTIVPEESWYVPLIAFSFGKSFFTEDPREGTRSERPDSVDPVETARSYQLVASKTFNKTDVKLTLGHETQSAEYGKIDPDQGLQFDLGPGRIRFWRLTVRQSIQRMDRCRRPSSRRMRVLWTWPHRFDRARGSAIDRRSHRDVSEAALPLAGEGRIRIRGKKGGWDLMRCEPAPHGRNWLLPRRAEQGVPLGAGAALHEGRINVGVNMMIASGWTGQTTENFAAASVYGPGKVGLGPANPDGLVPANPVNRGAR